MEVGYLLGSGTIWPSPVAKPSSETEICWTRASDVAGAPSCCWSSLSKPFRKRRRYWLISGSTSFVSLRKGSCQPR